MTTALATGLAVLAVIGGVVVVMTRDVMRMVLALGALLLAVAALFAVLGATFVAVAEVFVYVGGVLVIFLFAIMLVHRSDAASPELSSRHDVLSAVVAAGSFAMIVATFGPALRDLPIPAIVPSMKDLGAALTGPLRIHFEAAGVLLLAALVAVVAIMGGDDR